MSKPAIVTQYEEQLAAGTAMYFDPVELDEIFHYYAEDNRLNMLAEVLALSMRLHPDDVMVRQMDAEYELNMGDTALALEKLDRIYNPDHPFHNILRSAALAKLGRTAEALEAAQLALRDEDPKEFVAYDVALGFMNANMFALAQQYFRQSLRHHPDDSRTLSGLLYCASQLSLVSPQDDISDIAERLLQLDPYNYEAWMAKGNTLAQKELYAEAIDAYDYAMAIAPDEPDPQIFKAHCLVALEQPEEAMRLLTEARERVEGEQLATICLVLSAMYAEHKQVDEAKEAAWTAVTASGGDTTLLLKAAYAFLDIEAEVEALTVFEAVDEKMPDDVTVLGHLAELYGKTMQFELANKIYQRLSEIAPGASVYALWGGLNMSQGKYREAYRLFNKANQMEQMWQTCILMAACDVELQYTQRLIQDLRLAYAMCPDECFRFFETLCPDMYKELTLKGTIDDIVVAYHRWLDKYEDQLRRQHHSNPSQSPK
ncbi:MAG: tetratricopeptide repeat protein [Paludibacteraceae bacterium]|nr:tetratricopeptide repeat protein [Paludibacteraceae bacterium]